MTDPQQTAYGIVAHIETDNLAWQLDRSDVPMLRQFNRRDLVIIRALLGHCTALVDAALQPITEPEGPE